jgi:hypothetical protein
MLVKSFFEIIDAKQMEKLLKQKNKAMHGQEEGKICFQIALKETKMDLINLFVQNSDTDSLLAEYAKTVLTELNKEKQNVFLDIFNTYIEQQKLERQNIFETNIFTIFEENYVMHIRLIIFQFLNGVEKLEKFQKMIMKTYI